MKTIPRHLKAIPLVLVSVLIAPFVLAQPSENSSGAISVDRSVHYVQTGADQVTAQSSPYNFTFHVRGGSESLKTNWGPKFYKPGSAGVVQSGSSSATNTGTLNFSNTPNNGSDYMFFHEFDTNAAMEAFYPIAPTDGGQYGVKFLGSAPPTTEFTDGLVYAAGTTYPSAIPQVTTVDNGAEWVNGKLRIKPQGLTTLNLSAFSEYRATTYGSLIAVGIYDSTTGAVIDGASATAYYLPMGDSTEDAAITFNHDPITEITLDGSWLIPGRAYTIEIQYAIIAGRPEEAMLSGVEFQGVSSYRRVVSLQIVAGVSSSDFNRDDQTDIIWQNSNTGRTIVWLMNGTTRTSFTDLGTVGAAWRFSGSGDFNSDGKADVVLQHSTTGQIEVWLLNGTTLTSPVVIGTVNPEWHVTGVGDFNGDAKSDVVLQNRTSGRTIVWLMDGAIRTSYADIGTVNPEWHVAGIGDFNRDGESDVLFQNASNGRTIVWLMNGTTRISYADIATVNPEWRVAGAGDFNADGKADVTFQHTPTGRTIVWLMDGVTRITYADIATVSPEWRLVNRR